MNLIEVLQYHHDREQAIRENSARTAVQIATYESTGAGTTLLSQPLRFDTPFIGEPVVTSGFAIRRPPNARLYQLPRVSAGVYRWQIDREQNFHVGAFVYVAVDCPFTAAGQAQLDSATLTITPEPIVVHHLEFSGLSYKVLPGMQQLTGTIPPRGIPWGQR